MLAEKFIEKIESELGCDFYTGVPDSLLKPFSDTLFLKYGFGKKHIVAQNEGGAVGLAAGRYLSSGRPGVVYMQNSGIGNAVNPIVSLLDEKVYAIPCVFVVGLRGEPGVKDEPQHVFQGEITVKLLSDIGLFPMVISKDTDEDALDGYFKRAKELLDDGKCPAFVIKKGALFSSSSHKFEVKSELSREEAIEIITKTAKGDVFVSTTGKASRELFELREKRSEGHSNDFLTVGSMGHASMIALGIALNKPETKVWCIDGDGACLMHMGAMHVISKSGAKNIVHTVINNGSHESVGGMPIGGGAADFAAVAKASGYENVYSVKTKDELKRAVEQIKNGEEAAFLQIYTALGSRPDLGRPTTTPKQNKDSFMERLRELK